MVQGKEKWTGRTLSSELRGGRGIVIISKDSWLLNIILLLLLLHDDTIIHITIIYFIM